MDKNDTIKTVLDLIMSFFSKKDTPTPIAQKTEESKKEATAYKITKEELLKSRDKKYPKEYTQEVSDNLDKLLVPINKIRDLYGKSMTVTSGWRPAEINASAGGAAKSKHTLGLAVDILDENGDLMKWILANLETMKQLDIYFEDFRWTANWCHFQIGAPKSGKRIFVPNTSPATAPDRWDGKYDKKFDS